jgi:hypothetical protein
VKDEMLQCQQLNVAVQDFLRAWSDVTEKKNPAVMLDQSKLSWFAELNRSLNDTLDDEAFVERMRAALDQLRALAGEILARARQGHPGLAAEALDALLDAPGPATRRAEAAGSAARPMLFGMDVATAEAA